MQTFSNFTFSILTFACNNKKVSITLFITFSNKVIKVLITANDVLHAWALPAFGVKRDAVPGRINETWFKAEKVGTYYGQCSELCGIKHAFMPITVKVVSDEEYQEWLSEARVKFAKEEIENDKLKIASK